MNRLPQEDRNLPRNRRKPDLIAGVRIALLAILIAQGLRVAFTSPRLRLREVRVVGTARITPAEVIRRVGIRMGENIFRVNLVRVSDRLRSDPLFASAVTTRELPNALVVTLEERIPAIQVTASEVRGSNAQHPTPNTQHPTPNTQHPTPQHPTPNAQHPTPNTQHPTPNTQHPTPNAQRPAPGAVDRFDADAEGTVFRRSTAALAGLPQLELPAGFVPPVGKRLPEEVVGAVRECSRLADDERLQLNALRFEGGGELWLKVAAIPDGEPLSVRVGRPTELPEKFRDIRLALAGRPDLPRTAAYLDVMCAGRTAYMRLTDRRPGG